MATAVVTLSGGNVVSLAFAPELGVAGVPTAETGTEQPLDSGPNPIAPELKEAAWGFGAFLVFLFVMRLFLVPKVRQGMAERYDSIRADFDGADKAKADARADVAKYEESLVEVRAEAAKRVDAARSTLDRERGEAITAANQRIAARKAEAEAAAAAEREAARDQISAAVTTVTATATSIAVGKQADNSVVTQAVAQAMQNTGGRS